MNSKAILMIALAVSAAGCAESTLGNSSGDSSQGLVVQEFSVADSSITPGQRTPVTLILRNYHKEPIEIKDISLYNTGFLEFDKADTDWRDRCEPGSIEQARDDFKPKMKCSWILKAPNASEIGDFSSKSVSMKINLEYRSNISNNEDPFQIQFRPLEEIDSRQEVKKTFSNGEVEMSLSTENPAPESGTTLQASIRDVNSGDDRRVDSSYKFFYTPEEVFRPGQENGCPTEVEPSIGSSTDFTCRIHPSGSGGTVNLFISTSYKYVKSPNLGIEVSKP